MCGVSVKCMFLCNNTGSFLSHFMQHSQAHSTWFSCWIDLVPVSSNISFYDVISNVRTLNFEGSETAIGDAL